MEDNNNERLQINISEMEIRRYTLPSFDFFENYYFTIYINDCVFSTPEFRQKEEALNYKKTFINKINEDYSLIKFLIEEANYDLLSEYFYYIHIENANKDIYDYYKEDKILPEEVIDYLSKQKGVDNSKSKGESIFFDVNEKESEFNLLNPFGTEEDKQKLKEYTKEYSDIIQRQIDYYKKGNIEFEQLDLTEFQQEQRLKHIEYNELKVKVKKLSEKNKKLKAKNKKLTKQLRKLTEINTGE
jgi:hypothetical protein